MIEIISETKSYIVVIKPFGMESEHEVPAALAQLSGTRPEEYLCIHRLDQAAGGLLVYAKTKKAAADLSAQLADGRLGKEYLAVLAGVPEGPSGVLEDLLYRDRQKQKMFPVKKMRNGVKKASLEYTVLQTCRGGIPEGNELQNSKTYTNSGTDDYGTSNENSGNVLTLAAIRLHTGRYHQIRVQFASRGLPLVGDRKYGSRIRSPHLALFCHEMDFYDPGSGEKVSFRAEMPSEFPWQIFLSPCGG
ncbi:MAG: RluA family pseudouridine synthase [Lachnospiraceae bacterium]|nr:RluA family pseudouridine synthase [Lachnospiraceae bacterium]